MNLQFYLNCQEMYTVLSLEHDHSVRVIDDVKVVPKIRLAGISTDLEANGSFVI